MLLDLDDARLVDRERRQRSRAGAVLQLLLGVGVHVDLALRVRLHHELDRLADLDLDAVAVGRHGVAVEGHLDGLGRQVRALPGAVGRFVVTAADQSGRTDNEGEEREGATHEGRDLLVLAHGPTADGLHDRDGRDARAS